MNIHLAKHYLKHLLKAGNAHSLHSPFVFEFYNDCLKNQSKFYQFGSIEAERSKLKSSSKTIQITDFGAGSKVNTNTQRYIKDIAKNSLKPAFLGQQLFRIINFLKPKSIIDIGTSLGITTSYLAAVNPECKVITLEGCPNTAGIASNTFKSLDLNNIEMVVGEFSSTLPEVIDHTPSIDVVFFDGNHQFQATMDYFHLCKEKANENTCFIFDDIYWSKGMTKAWKEISNDPDVLVSIDTFYFGICFFRTNQPKQHFILK